MDGARDLLQPGARLDQRAPGDTGGKRPCPPSRIEPGGEQGDPLRDVVVQLAGDSRPLGLLGGDQPAGQLLRPQVARAERRLAAAEHLLRTALPAHLLHHGVDAEADVQVQRRANLHLTRGREAQCRQADVKTGG